MILSLDIETNSSGVIDVFRDRIVLVGCVLDEQEMLFDRQVPEWLLGMLADSKVLKLIHNAAFDLKFLQHAYGVVADNVWDTLAVERLLTSGKGLGCDLEAVAERRLNVKLNKEIRDTFALGRIGDEQREYCLQDARVLLPIYEQQRREVEYNKQMTAALIESRLGAIVADMELTGIGFDVELWNTMLPTMNQKRDAAEHAVAEALGIPCQLNMFGGSTPTTRITQRDQMLARLQERGIDLETYKGDDILYCAHNSKDTEHAKLLRAIMEFKKWDKAIGWDYPRFVHPVTGRIHAAVNPQGADTFRFAMSQPNLQQVTKPLSDDINFRHLFRAGPGRMFVGADYSQIELRVLAEETRDPDYIKAFTSGFDLHKSAAEAALGRPLNDKSERGLGKAINFGVASYGGGAAALMRSVVDYDIYLTEQEARKYVNAIKARNRIIEKWGKRMLNEMKQRGWIQTPIGHRRYLPDETRETVARNTPIQVFAGGIIKDAMYPIFQRLQNECSDAHLVLQVHDELVAECLEDDAERVRGIMVGEMKQAGSKWLKVVPVEVEAYISKTWEK